jgi:fumarate reductase subunit D
MVLIDGLRPPQRIALGVFSAIGAVLAIIAGVLVVLVLSIGGLRHDELHARTVLIAATGGFAALVLLGVALAAYLGAAGRWLSCAPSSVRMARPSTTCCWPRSPVVSAAI